MSQPGKQGQDSKSMVLSQPSKKPTVIDTPPQRVHDPEDLIRALISLILGLLVALASIYLRGTTAGVESDMRQAGHAMDWLMDVPTTFLQQAVTVTVVLAVLIHLLINREWIQSITAPLAMFLGY